MSPKQSMATPPVHSDTDPLKVVWRDSHVDAELQVIARCDARMLHATLDGVASAERVALRLDIAASELTSCARPRFLLDIRALRSWVSRAELTRIGATLAHRLPALSRLAFVVAAERAPHGRHGVVRHQQLLMRTFEEEHGALQWLNEDGSAAP